MRGVFFYTIGIAFTSGIFIRSFFDIGMSGVVLLCLLSATSFVAWRLITQSHHFESPLFLLSLACISLALGIWRMEHEVATISPLSVYEEKSVSLFGKIVREPEFRETNIHLYVKPVGTEEFSEERVLVLVNIFTQHAHDFSYGDIVRVDGALTLPEPFEADGGRVFDYPEYLKARGVTYTMPFAEVHIEQEASGTFFGYLFQGKKKFMETIERIIPEPHAGLGEGLLLGVKRALGENLEETFRETGIIHIVVLSGYNIMIVVACIMYVLGFFFFPKTRLVIGVVTIALFALLVGLSATVVRASVMASLLLVARATGRIYAVLRALMLAGVVMLIINPYLLAHDPGFQLSFIATLGLIVLSPHIEKYLGIIPETIGMRGIVTATIATQIFVLPLILYHMGLLSIVSVIVNALVLPMVPVAMFLTFITGVIGMVSSVLGQIVGYVAYLSLGYIIGVAEFFGALPFAAITIGTFPFWVVMVTYVCFTLVLVWLYKNKMEDDSFVATHETKPIVNDYEGWIIEEEKQNPPPKGEGLRDFPFR